MIHSGIQSQWRCHYWIRIKPMPEASVWFRSCNGISLAYCKTTFSPLLMHWRYCSSALKHWYYDIICLISAETLPSVHCIMSYWSLCHLENFVSDRLLGVEAWHITPLTILCSDHSRYGLSQWATTLHCNVVSHWLSPYSELPQLYGSVVIWLCGVMTQDALCDVMNGHAIRNDAHCQDFDLWCKVDSQTSICWHKI